MKHMLLCLCLVSALFLTGCASVFFNAPFKPPEGAIVTSLKAPLTANFESNEVCEKSGEASASFINLCFFTPYRVLTFGFGECDIEAAAKNGQLKSVEYADYERFSILGLYEKTTIRAYGK